MNEFVDAGSAVRIAAEIQKKYFPGRWNHEVMAVCCILLADEIAAADGVDRDAMLDDLVRQIKKFVALSIAAHGVQDKMEKE